MNGNEVGFVYWNHEVCPQWVSGDRFYNCEDFYQAVSRSGLHLGRMFQRSIRFWISSL